MNSNKIMNEDFYRKTVMGIRIPNELLQKVDEKRFDIPIFRFAVGVVEGKLKELN